MSLAAEEDTEEPAVKPKFLRGFSDTSATEGQRLVLETEVSAEPEPMVIWLKDGRELKSSESMKVLSRLTALGACADGMRADATWFACRFEFNIKLSTATLLSQIGLP